MALSRRNFFRTVGLGSAGLSTSFVVGQGGKASAFQAAGRGLPRPDDGGVIRLSNNENNRGPGPKAIEALHAAATTRMGRGYPPDYIDVLLTTIAGVYGVDPTGVLIGTGSGPILEGATRAFCSPGKPLVTVGPTYGTPEGTARRIGAPIRAVPVDRAFLLDLDAMAAAAVGAGMIYVCNPNNPTGTAHPAAAIEAFVRKVKAASPQTAILIDEAYIDYAHDAAIKTAAPLARQFDGVFITRSFSKAHGMAGLRLGYAIGEMETIRAISSDWQMGSVNTLTAAAAIASLRDVAHIADEKAENARVREFTLQAFRDMGYSAPDSHSNCVFVDLNGRPAGAFREASLAKGVRVGRDFPPFEKSHIRITLGTMAEMRQAVEVFRGVLTSKATASAV